MPGAVTALLFMPASLPAVAGTPAVSEQAARTFAWQSDTPEGRGLDAPKLETFRREMEERNTSALLVVRDDRVVLEWYAKGISRETRLGTASTAKGLVGGMAAAVELGEGLIRLGDKAARFVPQWSMDPVKSRITLLELGSHTSGIEDAEVYPQDTRTQGDLFPNALPHETLTGWKGDFWKRLPVPDDPFTISRDQAPMEFTPGTRFSYSNPGIAMLGYVLTAALAHRPESDLRELLRVRVMRPIGIADDEWRVGYNQTFEVDGLPLVAPWGGGEFTARGMARIARLLLRQGDWEGTRLLSREAVAAVTRNAEDGLPGDIAVGWWTNNHGTVPGLPRDAYFAQGAGHRMVVVIPSLDVIVVRNGGLLSRTDSFMEARDHLFFAPLMRALQTRDSSSPPSTDTHAN